MDPVISLSSDRSQIDPRLVALADSRLTAAKRSELEDSVARTHLPMARRLASRFTRTGADFDDLTQVASLALIKAIRRFNPDRGEFEKYAHATINGELKKYLRDQCWSVRPPRRVQELHSQVGLATESLAQATGRMPTVGVLAGELDACTADISEAIAARSCFRAVSLDQELDASGHSLGDLLAGECRDFDAVNDSLELTDLLKDLNEHERMMLWLRFVDGRTQREIAEVLGMSQMMVSRRLAVLVDGLRSRANRPEVA